MFEKMLQYIYLEIDEIILLLNHVTDVQKLAFVVQGMTVVFNSTFMCIFLGFLQ